MAIINSFFLSRSKWLKYIYRKKYRELQNGMRDWHKIGLKHTKTVLDSVETAERTGKDLDENIGILCFSIMQTFMKLILTSGVFDGQYYRI